MTNSGPGGFTRPAPSSAVQDEHWAQVKELAAEFPAWDITWTEYPQGWRFRAKPKRPSLRHADPWVIQETADKTRAAIQLRQTPQGNAL